MKKDFELITSYEIQDKYQGVKEVTRLNEQGKEEGKIYGLKQIGDKLYISVYQTK